MITARAGVIDPVGLALFGSAMAWSAFSDIASGGDSGPVMALLLATAAVLAASGWLAERERAVPLVVLTVAAGALALSSLQNLWSSSPLEGPLGYANAKGAFFALAAVGAAMLAFEARRPAARAMSLTVALVFVSVPVASMALTSAILALVLPVGALLVARTSGGRARTVVVALEALFIAIVVISTLLGMMDANRSPIAEVLGQTRIQMWQQATTMMLDSPLTGVGPDRFRDVSPIARADPDLRWAHNEFLQQGAEQGIPGMLLLVSLFVWAFVRLRSIPRPRSTQVLAAVAVVMLGIQGDVDYVFHFPAIPLVAAVLTGVGLAREAQREANVTVDSGVAAR